MISITKEMAASGSDQIMRYLAYAAIRDSKPEKAACELISLLAIHCPANSAGVLKLMSALSYLYKSGR